MDPAVLARATHRIVHPGLALATGLLLGLVSGWVAFTLQHDALADAKRTGSDPVALLTATRILASRAQAKEGIALARAAGARREGARRRRPQLQSVTRPIAGLLIDAADVSGTSVRPIERAYRRNLAAHADVVEQVKRGQFDEAVKLAVQQGLGGGPSTGEAGAALNGALDREVERAQARFAVAQGRADGSERAAGEIPVLIGCA